VRVRLDAPEPGLRATIEAALAGKPVRLARIDTSMAAARSPGASALSVDELDRLQPEDIFNRLYRSKYDTDTPASLQTAFAELLLGTAGESV
jgi:exonuclease SbcD